MRLKKIVIILTATMLLGSGCVGASVSNLTSEQASASLALSVGYQIALQPTILGFGGNVVAWLGADEEERTIVITDWTPGEKVALDWSIATQVETAESVSAREAYEQIYSSSPVGVEIPAEPEPTYKEQLVHGNIASESLASADTLGLPQSWSEGDAGLTTSSLIWLSALQYDELVSRRSTVVSLGLFDESLMRVENATNQLTMIVERLSGILDPILGEQKTVVEVQEDTKSLLTLEADAKWGEYTLLVDGVQTEVRVVLAKNAFASYTILANPDNPLILEIQLTPLSQGNLELLSQDGFTEGFGGYEVTQISSSSVGRPQH